MEFTQSNNSNNTAINSENTTIIPTANIKNELYPNSKTVLVSTRRPKSFLERTSRELLAGGTEYIILSALGDAIPLCVKLHVSLINKKATLLVKIETTSNHCQNFNQRGGVVLTPGLRIYMKKHPEFKGSRISPAYVRFSPNPNNITHSDNRFHPKHTPVYDSDSKEGFASVNAGDIDFYVGGGGINKEFHDVLLESNQNVEKYQVLHNELLQRALEENKNNKDNEIRSVLIDNPVETHPDVKVALCRINPDLRKYDPSGKLGCVFISSFKHKFPKNSEYNIAMVYVVGPKGDLFENKSDFLYAVHSTAANLMTALCDFNGFVRRDDNKMYLRIASCRICLFSGGSYKHPEASSKEIADNIIFGLNEAYRHGPAPRLEFAYCDDIFRKSWIEITETKFF